MEKEIKKLVNEELNKANEKYGNKFPTVEHALSVIREEVEEVEEGSKELKKDFEKMWKNYRGKLRIDDELIHMEFETQMLIEEAIQVLAMIKKYRKSFKED